jgi:amidase
VGLWIVQVLLVLSCLPQGVQLIGGLYREDLCLDAAAAIEKRLGTITPTEPRSYSSTDHR